MSSSNSVSIWKDAQSLAALLFLIQRGLAAGITIYAPSIILSTLLDWNLTVTNADRGPG
ncbi:MAG: hypothetical protein R3F17_08955 [Planctomycetota bacterium]